MSLYVSALLLANQATTPASAIDASVGIVQVGGTAEVRINASPCQPVTVKIEIGGYSQTVTIEHVPNTAVLDIPADTELRGYTITITCATDRLVLQGVVI